jgi:hypothetical protein
MRHKWSAWAPRLYGNAPNIRCRDPLNFELCSRKFELVTCARAVPWHAFFIQNKHLGSKFLLCDVARTVRHPVLFWRHPLPNFCDQHSLQGKPLSRSHTSEHESMRQRLARWFVSSDQNGQKQIGELCGATVRQYSLFCKPSGRVSQVVQGAASLIF